MQSECGSEGTRVVAACWKDPPRGAARRAVDRAEPAQRALARLDGALTGALAYEVPPELTLALLAQAAAATRVLAPRPVPWWRDRGLWTEFAFGVAAVAATLVLLFWPGSLDGLFAAVLSESSALGRGVALLGRSPATPVAFAWLDTVTHQSALLLVAVAAWLLATRLLPEPRADRR